MLVRILCSEADCRSSARVDTDKAKAGLRVTGRYSFGDHVSDPRAFACRAMWFAGWRTVSRVGKSTVTMRCPGHGRAEHL